MQGVAESAQTSEGSVPSGADGGGELGDIIVCWDANAQRRTVLSREGGGDAAADRGRETRGVVVVVGVQRVEDCARDRGGRREHADCVERVGVRDHAPAREQPV